MLSNYSGGQIDWNPDKHRVKESYSISDFSNRYKYLNYLCLRDIRAIYLGHQCRLDMIFFANSLIRKKHFFYVFFLEFGCVQFAELTVAWHLKIKIDLPA